MATEYVISIKVTGSESASGPLGMVGGALGRIAEFVTAGVIFRGLEAITSKLTSMASAGFDAATGFETVMSRIKGLTTTPIADVGKMSDDILRLSKEMNISAIELGQAEYFIASSGFAGAQATDILTASAKAASAGLGDTKTIADAVTSALNAYKLNAGDAAKIVDVLTRAVVEGKGEPAEFAGSLGRVLPIAAAAGVNFEQVAASMATMTRTGLSAEEAATALRGTLGALLAPGKQARDELSTLGLSMDDVAKSLREKGLLATLQDLMTRTHGNVDALDLIIPNIRALTGVLSTAGSQADAYAQILGSMKDATGSTDKAFMASAQTWEFEFGRFKNVLLALPIEVGQKVLPGLTGALGSITDEVNRWAGPLADKIAGPLEGIATRLRVAAQTGGIQGVINEIGKMLSEGWNNLVLPKIKEWATSFWEWITGKEGALTQVPATMNKLIDSINKWANDPGTQAQLAVLGERAGKGLVDGVGFLLGQTETWTPIVANISKALGEALAPAAIMISGSFVDSFMTNLTKSFGLNKAWQSFEGIVGMLLGIPPKSGGGTTNNSNTTIYGGVQNYGGGSLADFLRGLVP